MIRAIAVAALVLATTCAFGQGANQSALTDLEAKWVAALAKADTGVLTSILHETYVDTDEEGNRTDRAGVLAALKSKDLKISAIKLSNMRVYEYGTAAVVTGVGEQTGTFQGRPLVAKIVFTDTFVLANGKWRAVASHRTPFPAK
jgi:hypothetical protein